jgi:hypothetical protein
VRLSIEGLGEALAGTLIPGLLIFLHRSRLLSIIIF